MNENYLIAMMKSVLNECENQDMLGLRMKFFSLRALTLHTHKQYMGERMIYTYIFKEIFLLFTAFLLSFKDIILNLNLIL